MFSLNSEMQRAQKQLETQKKNKQPIQMRSNSMVTEVANEESTLHPPPAKRDKIFTVARVEPSNSMVAEVATRYNLRESKRTNEESPLHPPPAKRVKTLTVARVEPIPKFMPTSRDSLILGQIVLAKMKSYAAWPAYITELRPSCVGIRFFGEDTHGTVPYKGIGSFEENCQLMLFHLKRNVRGYEKAMRTVEISMAVPSKDSIFNKI